MEPETDNDPVLEAPRGPPDQEALARKFQKELNAGLVALVLLAILDRAPDELYGYQIAKRLQHSPGSPIVKQGALYPVLRTLSSLGLLGSRVVPSIAGPPRRYYHITDAGRGTLTRWRGIWSDTRNFVDNFTESQGETP